MAILLNLVKSLRWLMCRAQDDFIVLTLLIMYMIVCPVTIQMLGFLPLYVMLNIRLSIVVCAPASLFCTCCLVHVDWGVVYNHHLSICDVHLQTLLPTYIG